MATKEQKKRFKEVEEESAQEEQRLAVKYANSLEKYRQNPYLVVARNPATNKEGIVDISESGRALIAECLTVGIAIKTVASKLGISLRHFTDLRKENADLEELIELCLAKDQDEIIAKLRDEALSHEGKGPNKSAELYLKYVHGYRDNTIRGEEPQKSNPTVNVQINMRAPMSADSAEFRAKYGEIEASAEIVTDAEVVHVESGDSD